MSRSLRYSSVLFDLDGTLIDSAEDLVASVRHALRLLDDREPPDRETILLEVGKPLETILGNFGYPTDPESSRVFVDGYRRHYAEHLNEHTRPYPGVVETLGRLVSAGARLAVVTTKHQVQAELAVRASGLDGFFDYVHGWQEGRRHKPDPEPMNCCLEKLGARAADALVVGDSEQDLLAARATGIATCAVTWGFRPVLLLRMLRPDYMISRPTDLVPVVVA